MSDDVTGNVVLLLFCLSLSFFFSSVETAITATRRARLLALKDTHANRAKLFDWVLNEPQRALTVTLVGNNIVNIAASAFATSLAIRLMGNTGTWLAVALMTLIIVVFCEILPKSIAITCPERILTTTLPVLKKLNNLLAPVLWLTSRLVQSIGKLFGMDLSSKNPFVTREEIEHIVNVGEETGALEEDERRMIHGVISFEETRVSEVMVPRTDMVAVPSSLTVGKAVETFRETGHSRMPVYEGDLDHIVGILYVKDLLEHLAQGRVQEPISTLHRPPLFVPETMKTSEIFEIMKKGRVHMAIVVDEYGGTAGLVTLEDLLEEIVGEIQDEYDRETPPILQEDEGCFLVQGHVNLEDLSEALDSHFESEDVDTVAGLVLALAGDFPKPGQRLDYGPWEIEVVEVKGHRITQVRLIRRPMETDSDDEE